MNKFEIIVDNYVNGNRGDARKGFAALTPNEKADFKDYMRDVFRASSWPDESTMLFDMVMFLLTA